MFVAAVDPSHRVVEPNLPCLALDGACTASKVARQALHAGAETRWSSQDQVHPHPCHSPGLAEAMRAGSLVACSSGKSCTFPWACGQGQSDVHLHSTAVLLLCAALARAESVQLIRRAGSGRQAGGSPFRGAGAQQHEKPLWQAQSQSSIPQGGETRAPSPSRSGSSISSGFWAGLLQSHEPAGPYAKNSHAEQGEVSSRAPTSGHGDKGKAPISPHSNGDRYAAMGEKRKWEALATSAAAPPVDGWKQPWNYGKSTSAPPSCSPLPPYTLTLYCLRGSIWCR